VIGGRWPAGELRMKGMYTTPFAKKYFLQRRSGMILTLAAFLSSGLIGGLIMELVYQKTSSIPFAYLIFCVLLVPPTYVISKLNPQTTRNVYILGTINLALAIYDSLTRGLNARTIYFVIFGLVFNLLIVWAILRKIQRKSDQELNRQNFFIRGANAYHSHDFKTAIAEFTQSIKFGNQSRDVYYFRGICYGMLDQYTEALSDFRDVMAIDPAFEDVYFWRGLTYSSIDPSDGRAVSDFERAVAKCDDEKLKDLARHNLHAIQRTAAAPADSQ
jgi:tetratricopeptide (TPR) repeat protein